MADTVLLCGVAVPVRIGTRLWHGKAGQRLMCVPRHLVAVGLEIEKRHRDVGLRLYTGWTRNHGLTPGLGTLGFVNAVRRETFSKTVNRDSVTCLVPTGIGWRLKLLTNTCYSCSQTAYSVFVSE